LQTLTVRQDQAPGRITTADYKFTLPSLKEVVDYGLAFNAEHRGRRNPDGRLVGLLIESKHEDYYRSAWGLEIGQIILQTLKDYHLDTPESCQERLPIYLQSFDIQTLEHWAKSTTLPLSYLCWRK
jgi:hypothetical protein